LKKYWLFILVAVFFIMPKIAISQKIDSIYINLYTDSLKKGTYNYINVDGLLSNGKFLPLDSTYILFSASAGKFFGNSLFIDKDFVAEKVSIKVALRKNSAIFKEFILYIKIKGDTEPLKTVEELTNSIRPTKGKRKKGKN
jgi:hypothetical protein